MAFAKDFEQLQKIRNRKFPDVIGGTGNLHHCKNQLFPLDIYFLYFIHLFKTVLKKLITRLPLKSADSSLYIFFSLYLFLDLLIAIQHGGHKSAELEYLDLF